MSSEYGIYGGTIYKWIKALKPIDHIDSDTPLNQKDIQAMQKRIRELEMENEILKKATNVCSIAGFFTYGSDSKCKIIPIII